MKEVLLILLGIGIGITILFIISAIKIASIIDNEEGDDNNGK